MSSRFVQNEYLSPSGNTNDGVTPNPGVVLDGTLVVTANFTSAPINVANSDAFAISFATPSGSTLVGTAALQVSNDQSGQELTKAPGPLLTNWQTLSYWDVGTGAQSSAAKAVATGQNTVMLAERVCTYRWVRLVFVFTSGTGKPQVTFQSKGVA